MSDLVVSFFSTSGEGFGTARTDEQPPNIPSATWAITAPYVRAALFVYVLVTQMVTFTDVVRRPFILEIMSVILSVALSFAIVVGALGAIVGRRSASHRPGPQGA